MIYRSDVVLVTVMLTICAGISLHAAGITADAGLTPPEDRWIFRTQLRYIERGNDPTPMDREMTVYALPFVLAYGIRSDFTLMGKQVFMFRNMSMPGDDETDFGRSDLFLLGKYKAYRINTPEYTFGIAPSLGLELPSGSKSFTSETWDIHTGLNVSFRTGPWAGDFNLAYMWNGAAGEGPDGEDPGDAISVDIAFARQYGLGAEARSTIAPVFEINYSRTFRDYIGENAVPNTGETLLNLSPGLQYIAADYFVEFLIQIPVWQDQIGNQLEYNGMLVLAIRYLF